MLAGPVAVSLSGNAFVEHSALGFEFLDNEVTDHFENLFAIEMAILRAERMCLGKECFSGIAAEDIIEKLDNLLSGFVKRIHALPIDPVKDLGKLFGNFVVAFDHVDVSGIKPEHSDLFSKLVSDRHGDSPVLDNNGHFFLLLDLFVVLSFIHCFLILHFYLLVGSILPSISKVRMIIN